MLELFSFNLTRSVNFLLEAISNIVDHVQWQGASQRKSAAYTVVCEHFEEAGNIAIGRQMHF